MSAAIATKFRRVKREKYLFIILKVPVQPQASRFQPTSRDESTHGFAIAIVDILLPVTSLPVTRLPDTLHCSHVTPTMPLDLLITDVAIGLPLLSCIDIRFFMTSSG